VSLLGTFYSDIQASPYGGGFKSSNGTAEKKLGVGGAAPAIEKRKRTTATATTMIKVRGSL